MITMKTTITYILALTTLALASCSRHEPASTSPESAPTATATNTDTYPLTTCVVSGETLGSMGAHIIIDHRIALY